MRVEPGRYKASVPPEHISSFSREVACFARGVIQRVDSSHGGRSVTFTVTNPAAFEEFFGPISNE